MDETVIMSRLFDIPGCPTTHTSRTSFVKRARVVGMVWVTHGSPLGGVHTGSVCPTPTGGEW